MNQIKIRLYSYLFLNNFLRVIIYCEEILIMIHYHGAVNRR
jgi:hypothetical protein